MRLALLMLLTGCASQDKALMMNEVAPGGAELDSEANQLRVDIIPGETTPWLDRQSWIASADTDWGGLEIDIEPSVRVTGQVTGYTPTPYGAEVPGVDETPVLATVSLVREGTISGSSVATDENGQFTLYVPAARGYTMSIVPDDGQNLPFLSSVNTNFESPTDLGQIELGYGEPVHGHITDDSGAAVSGARVHLVDAATGTSGVSVLTNENGRYLLRALPGIYTLVVQGQPGRAVPRIPRTIEVLEDHGVDTDIDIGSLEPIQVFGQVMQSDGNTALRDVRIRFTSDMLSGSDGTLEIETESDGDGLFNRNLLPGMWTAQLIPPYDSEWASTEIPFSVSEGDGEIDLGQVELPSKIEFNSVAIDDSSNTVPGAAVNARELGFDGYIHSTTTAKDGRFSLMLPPHPISLMVDPPGEQLAVTNVFIDPTGDPGSVLMTRGQRVEGRITSVGMGVGFALIEIRDIAGQLYATALTDPEGRFQLRMEAF